MPGVKISRHERVAICVTAVVVFVVVLAVCFLGKTERANNSATPDSVLAEYRSFAVSRQNARALKPNGKKMPRAVAKLHAFNPNTADSITLISLGLNARQVSAVINYRKAGGVFAKREDFKRIYNIGDAEYSRLAPYVRVPRAEKTEPRAVVPQKYADTKLHEGETVDLNCGDTAVFKRVPGVGSVIARCIVEYGEKLGGYVSPSQATEVYGIEQSMLRWFDVKSPMPNKINLNTANYAQLIRHPYINKAQTRAILKLRKEWGRIRSLNSLEQDTAFAAKDIARLMPYASF